MLSFPDFLGYFWGIWGQNPWFPCKRVPNRLNGTDWTLFPLNTINKEKLSSVYFLGSNPVKVIHKSILSLTVSHFVPFPYGLALRPSTLNLFLLERGKLIHLSVSQFHCLPLSVSQFHCLHLLSQRVAPVKEKEKDSFPYSFSFTVSLNSSPFGLTAEARSPRKLGLTAWAPYSFSFTPPPIYSVIELGFHCKR